MIPSRLLSNCPLAQYDHNPGCKPCRACGELVDAYWTDVVGAWVWPGWCDTCLRADIASTVESQVEAYHAASTKARWKVAGLTPAEVALDHDLLPTLHDFTLDPHPAAWIGYLCGGTGTGKTSQGVAAVKHYVHAGWRCRYVVEADLLQLMRPGGGATLETWTELDLLVIDEFGSDSRTEWSGSTLRSILNTRHRYKRATLLLSNHSLHAIAHHQSLGRMIAERLIEGGGGLDAIKRGEGLYQELTYNHRIGCKAPLPNGALGLGRLGP